MGPHRQDDRGSDWHDGFVLESEWTPQDGAGSGAYRLLLTNRTATAIEGFRLGLSGPARISDDATISGGHVVAQVSNFCELAPAPGFVLAPGATWTLDIGKLDYPVRHWTDGATTGFVIRADGSTISALTLPTRNTSNATPRPRGTMRLPGAEEMQAPVSIVPWPRSVAVSGRRSAPQGLAIEATDPAAKTAAAGFVKLVAQLFAGEGLVRSETEGGLPVRLDCNSSFSAEGYAISFSAHAARIEAATHAGFLYGLVTLGQILRGARLEATRFSFPISGRIEDSPRMGWRGCHLDVARRFYAGDEIKSFLAILAWNKLNRFHWHLSDDEAWRIEIDAFPELTATAAWRGYGFAVPPLLGSGPERTGGFYSKALVRDIVALGTEFGIEIVPEIDVPGHCYAMLQVLPQLADPGETGLYHSIQSFPNNCLNPAMESVYPVIETIFSEMIALFPSRYFHIGGDEVPAGAWASSPKARALLAEKGVEGAAPLQAHFLQKVQAFLRAKGKITGAWEEASQGGGIGKADCYLVGWHTVEASQRLAREGYDVVVSPGQAYYLDMANGPEWHEPGAAWAGWSSPQKAYGFDPSEGWSEAERQRLLGVQACIWSEPMSDRGVFDRLVFPRLSAIAETGWSAAADKDFGRFSALVGLMPNLYGLVEQGESI